MPTPESAAAFAKLAEKRARLGEISKELHDALADRFSIAGSARYKKLQAEWEFALRETEAATEEFSAIIKRLQEETGKRG